MPGFVLRLLINLHLFLFWHDPHFSCEWMAWWMVAFARSFVPWFWASALGYCMFLHRRTYKSYTGLELYSTASSIYNLGCNSGKRWSNLHSLILRYYCYRCCFDRLPLFSHHIIVLVSIIIYYSKYSRVFLLLLLFADPATITSKHAIRYRHCWSNKGIGFYWIF